MVLPLAAGVVLSGCVATTGQSGGQADGPFVASYLVADSHTKKVLVSHQPVKRLPVASLVKVASAIVAIDWAEAGGVSLSTKVLVPQAAHPALLGQASVIGLMPGDYITMRDALYAMLMVNDNASCVAIADTIGRDLLMRTERTGDPIAHFTLQLNALATRLGMAHTRFSNPHGLDPKKGRGSLSTAADMAKLGIEASSRSSMLFYSGQKQRVVSVFTTVGEKRLKVKNTNGLIGIRGIDGLKVGQTAQAGPCLLLTAARPSKIQKLADGRSEITPQRMVVVILNGSDSLKLGEKLLGEGWDRYDAWYAAGMTYTSVEEFLQNL